MAVFVNPGRYTRPHSHTLMGERSQSGAQTRPQRCLLIRIRWWAKKISQEHGEGHSGVVLQSSNSHIRIRSRRKYGESSCFLSWTSMKERMYKLVLYITIMYMYMKCRGTWKSNMSRWWCRLYSVCFHRTVVIPPLVPLFWLRSKQQHFLRFTPSKVSLRLFLDPIGHKFVLTCLVLSCLRLRSSEVCYYDVV
jgi:hypothetical protein